MNEPQPLLSPSKVDAMQKDLAKRTLRDLLTQRKRDDYMEKNPIDSATALGLMNDDTRALIERRLLSQEEYDEISKELKDIRYEIGTLPANNSPGRYARVQRDILALQRDMQDMIAAYLLMAEGMEQYAESQKDFSVLERRVRILEMALIARFPPPEQK